MWGRERERGKQRIAINHSCYFVISSHIRINDSVIQVRFENFLCIEKWTDKGNFDSVYTSDISINLLLPCYTSVTIVFVFVTMVFVTLLLHLRHYWYFCQCFVALFHDPQSSVWTFSFFPVTFFRWSTEVRTSEWHDSSQWVTGWMSWGRNTGLYDCKSYLFSFKLVGTTTHSSTHMCTDSVIHFSFHMFE